MSPIRLAAAIAAAILLGGCAPDAVVDGRPYALTLPDSADSLTPLPLVLLLHGFGANGPLQESFFDLSAAVDEEDFILALPNGTVDQKGRRFWNGAEACCQADDHPVEVDDVAYLRAVIEDVRRRHPVDADRVFIVGHSNGGFMALRMACEAGDLITAVASVAGAAFDDFSRCTPGRPVSVVQLHGTEDTVIRFDGGATSYGAYPGALETTARFAARNGCAKELRDVGRADLADVDGEETLQQAWAGCPPGGAVALWRMEGVGHLPDFHQSWAARVFNWLDEHRR